ncbi:hypothetical protein PBY51_009878 [Eleginops maclovinus]|uniref:non-specific serine/threonine protein kinase n=1 Tax=Eleginops maclovinus TaxID=56733 RepID=A0AAN8AQT1_ELEMC|nr:hypothetical protein PBY51_009878 [Eleginops maclovinus]
MDSKTCPTTSTIKCPSSRRQRGCNTDPIKAYNRNSEECLKITKKRSRTSKSPYKGCRRRSSGPSSRAPAATSAQEYSNTTHSTGETQSLPGQSAGGVSVSKSQKNRHKKRSTKKRQWSPQSEEQAQTFRGSSSSTEDAGAPTPASNSNTSDAKERKREKSDSEESKRVTKRSRKTLSKCPSGDIPSSSVSAAYRDNIADFYAKYQEEDILGEGGFGSVYAGYRKEDNLPVAIKHIPQHSVKHTAVELEGKVVMVPMEVVLHLKLKPAEGESSAIISLHDWYSLDSELILVMERPVPCMDMIDYLNSRPSILQEHEAKEITRQLVDALIEVHSKGVFHRDIKLDNILMETGSEIPRVRLIDFGCGTFLLQGMYHSKQGTYSYTTPEWFKHGSYRAEPTTVWQVGMVLFGILHSYLPFKTRDDIISVIPKINKRLSYECRDFLQGCLKKSPEGRTSLEGLKRHPWLV